MTTLSPPFTNGHRTLTAGLMPDFDQGAGLRLPFPHADGSTNQHRPALLLAAIGPAAAPFVLWVLMITSAQGRPWPQDVAIPDHLAAGLPAPSVIRCAKIATIDATRAEVKGHVSPDGLAQVRQTVAAMIQGAISLDGTEGPGAPWPGIKRLGAPGRVRGYN